MDDVNTYELQRDRFLERLLRSARGTFETFTVYMGHRLGYYATLAGNQWTTIAELAEKTGTDRRYAKEWLEQQTSVGILEVEDTRTDEASRRFRLPAAHAEVLAEPESLNYLAPLSQIVVGAVRPVPRVLEAYRKGGGVPYGDDGADLREGQAAMNRAMFLKLMGSEWLPSIPDLHARLGADPPARVADIGCGMGWSSIGIARAYPKVKVDGYDLDHPSVEAARHNAKDSAVADRVRFHVRHASDPALKGRYDLVAAFECVHDLADPVGALRTMLNLAGEDGSVLVMDERVADVFAPHGSEVEQLLYGFSVLHCLPAGMADQPSVGTGTIMRADMLKRYAVTRVSATWKYLPIENFFFRFYRLKPVCPVA